MSIDGKGLQIENSQVLVEKVFGKMMGFVRNLVSKRKRRFRQDGFDLDLSYITDRTIVMGFPAEGREGLFRNPLSEVMRFLTHYHAGHFMVVNLCAEREYDPNKLGGNVERIPLEDHQPAPLNVILKFCEIAEEWLKKDDKNVLVTHCKAGKGRAGLMVSCYLLYIKKCSDPSSALQFYAEKRTTDGQGVTLPSQRRYVGYFHDLIQNGVRPVSGLELAGISFSANAVRIKELQVVVSCNHGNGTCKVDKRFSTLEQKTTRTKSDRTLTLAIGDLNDDPIWITGDVKVEFLADTEAPLFYFWFNTSYVDGTEFSLGRKDELDKPPKSMESDIQVSLFFTGRMGPDNDACQKIIDEDKDVSPPADVCQKINHQDNDSVPDVPPKSVHQDNDSRLDVPRNSVHPENDSAPEVPRKSLHQDYDSRLDVPRNSVHPENDSVPDVPRKSVHRDNDSPLDIPHRSFRQ